VGPPPIGGPPPGGGGKKAFALVGVGLLVVVLLVAGVFALTRRGGEDVATGPSTTTAPTTAAPDPSDPAGTPTSTGPSATTTTTGRRPASPGGTPFADPQGAYTVEVAPAWSEVDSKVSGVEAWLTGDTDGEFRDNVNISTERAAGLLDVEAAVAYVRDQIEKNPSMTVDDTDYLTSTSGRRVGRLTVSNTIGGRQARQQAYVVQGPGNLLILTVSALPDRADRVFAEVEPFALTLRSGTGTT
jgi:hypothetical protein